MSKMDTATLQQWMKDIITSRGDLQHKAHFAAQHTGLSPYDVVSENYGAPIHSRLNVYTSGYIIRLQECLAADFPVLQYFMGEEVFNKFTEACLVWSPPTSYTLYDLGHVFIAFMEATMPKQPIAAITLPVVIAKVERARQEALRYKGNEGAENIMAVWGPLDVMMNLPSIKITKTDCLRLLEVPFDIKTLFTSFYNNEPPYTPDESHHYLAISRAQYRLVMEYLTEMQYVFLRDLEEYSDINTQISSISRYFDVSSGEVWADISIMLPVFFEKGYIQLHATL